MLHIYFSDSVQFFGWVAVGLLAAQSMNQYSSPVFYNINASKHVFFLIISTKSLSWSINLITLWIIIFLNAKVAADCDSLCCNNRRQETEVNDILNISAKDTFVI